MALRGTLVLALPTGAAGANVVLVADRARAAALGLRHGLIGEAVDELLKGRLVVDVRLAHRLPVVGRQHSGLLVVRSVVAVRHTRHDLVAVADRVKRLWNQFTKRLELERRAVRC
jgi:hypothetical protein